MPRRYSITGGLTLTDDQRPWWATDNGNLGNYVLNSASGRTVGVIGYWHVDGGNTANPGSFNGNALPAMTWAGRPSTEAKRVRNDSWRSTTY